MVLYCSGFLGPQRGFIRILREFRVLRRLPRFWTSANERGVVQFRVWDVRLGELNPEPQTLNRHWTHASRNSQLLQWNVDLGCSTAS